MGCTMEHGISLHAFTTTLYGEVHHPDTGPVPWRALWHGVQQAGLEKDIARLRKTEELFRKFDADEV